MPVLELVDSSDALRSSARVPSSEPGCPSSSATSLTAFVPSGYADLSDRRLRPYSGMTDGQLRRGEGFRRDNPQGLFIGESARVIERALDAGVRPVSVLVDDRWLMHDQAVIERVAAAAPDAPIFRATPEQFRSITGYEVVRGALACFERPAAHTVEEVIADARRIVILEDITNYANMGALFRSAAALDWDGVLVTPSCHDPYYRRCARVSMGAVFQVPWARINQRGQSPKFYRHDKTLGTAPFDSSMGGRDWAPNLLPRLRELGFTTVALALRDESIDLRDPLLTEPERLAVVLGTEGDGLRDSTIESCDYTICIPMAHGVDSLNVAACAAIVLWQLA